MKKKQKKMKKETKDLAVKPIKETEIKSLVELIDNSITSDREESDTKVSDWWRASEIGLCMRKALFRRSGVKPTPMTPRELKTMKVGELFHQYMQGLTKKYNISMEQELFLEDKKLEYRGKIDDIIKINDKIIAVEYKSENSNSFTWRERREEKISSHHEIQGMSYLHFLKKLNKYPELNTVRFVYISKDDFRMDEYEKEYSEEYGKFIENLLKKLSRYFKSNKLPAPINFKKNKDCGWQCATVERYGMYKGKLKPRCQFFKHCRKLIGDYNEPELIPNYNNQEE